MKKILILVILILTVSFVSGQVNTTVECEQTSSGCCKENICEEAQVMCEEGYISTFEGCDEGCRPIVQCVKDYFVCEDSDNGKNYYEQGKVYIGDEANIDFCEDDTMLREYFCLNDGVDSIEYKCPFGCKDDICLVEEECTFGGYQCNGFFIQKCDYATGKWFDSVYCKYGCRNGKCNELGNLPIDLSNYPNMFIRNGKILNVFVVGSSSPASDTIALVDISTSIQNEIKNSYGNIVEIDTESKLDYEVTNDMNNLNIISIGNPCNNKVTNEIMGHPYTCLKGLNEGEGIIKLEEINGYAHLAVYGYSDQDTRKAVKVLANWKNYNLNGRKIIIKGDYSNPVVDEEPSIIEPIIENVPEPSVSSNGGSGEAPITIPEPITTQLCNGCLRDDVCIPFGTRLIDDVPIFCDVNSKSFVEQYDDNTGCNNNFECKTNLCIDGNCLSSNVWQRFLQWFGSLFG